MKRICVVVYAIFFSLVIAGCVKEDPAPKARAGYLDLSRWNFEHDGIVSLDGEWEFYWRQLLRPADFHAGTLPAKTGFFPIPNYWNGHTVGDTAITGEGYATHRLRVKLKPGQGELALKAECIGGSFKIWADRDLIVWGGFMDKEEAAEPSRPFIHLVSPVPASGSGVIEIVFQVANDTFYTGGPCRKISLGNSSLLARDRMIYWSIDVFLFGCLAIIGIYHVIFYLLRRKDYSPLYFGCMCLLWSIELLIMGALRGNSFLITFPSYSVWNVVFRIELLLWYLFTPLLLMFIAALYPREISKRVVHVFQGTALLFSGAVFFMPERLLGYYGIPSYEYISFAGSIYAVFVLIRSSMRGRDGAYVLLAGLMALFLAALNDFLFVNNIIYTWYLLSVGIAVMSFSQAFVLSRRFSQALSDSEALTAELERNLRLKTELSERKESEERALIRAERETLLKLRYQLNPHFLFNVLASIRGAIGGSGAIAREMVTALSEFCRLTLTSKETESSTVGEEIRLIGLYLRIEQIRLGDYLNVRIDVDPEVCEAVIPSLMLQPLVENALKYGKRTSPRQLGITVAIKRQGGRILVEVANDGSLRASGQKSGEESTGIGLDNLRQRLDRIYAGDFLLAIDEEDGQVCVRIDLPAGMPEREQADSAI